MANGWNSGSDREAMLRRVAIVLSSLPGPVAADLLGEIDADTKKAVRRTMASLTDVDPLEQKRALHAFKISVQKPDELPDRFQSSVDGRTETGDTVQIRQQQVGNPGSRVVPSSMDSSKSADHAPHDPQNKTQPFAFIEHVSEQAVVHLLGIEHPQTVAIVLASIQPDQAARILPRLDSGLQQEALARIGRLGEIPAASIADVAEQFRNSLANESAGSNDSVGRRALDAILAAMPNANGQHDDGSPQPASNTHHVHAANRSRSSVYETTQHSSSEKERFPSAVNAAQALSSKLRIAEGTISTPSSETSYSQASNALDRSDVGLDFYQASVDAEASVPTEAANTVGETGSFPSTDSIHQHLLKLSPQHLCETLGNVETRTAMLALCGLPNQVTSAVLALLPKAQSRKVGQAMNSLGVLQLREIDQAKEAIAYASRNVVNQSVPKAA
jgi:flagellar motor switch protein FliG